MSYPKTVNSKQVKLDMVLTSGASQLQQSTFLSWKSGGEQWIGMITGPGLRFRILLRRLCRPASWSSRDWTRRGSPTAAQQTSSEKKLYCLNRCYKNVLRCSSITMGLVLGSPRLVPPKLRFISLFYSLKVILDWK